MDASLFKLPVSEIHLPQEFDLKTSLSYSSISLNTRLSLDQCVGWAVDFSIRGGPCVCPFTNGQRLDPEPDPSPGNHGHQSR